MFKEGEEDYSERGRIGVIKERQDNVRKFRKDEVLDVKVRLGCKFICRFGMKRILRIFQVKVEGGNKRCRQWVIFIQFRSLVVECKYKGRSGLGRDVGERWICWEVRKEFWRGRRYKWGLQISGLQFFFIIFNLRNEKEKQREIMYFVFFMQMCGFFCLVWSV